MTLEKTQWRDLYELANERNGKDKADKAARAANAVFDEIKFHTAWEGLRQIPGDDRAETLVTAIFQAIMEANQ